jgi:NADPH-dependent curcumin reductase CurA
VKETSRRVVLAERPVGMVDERTTRLEEVPVPVPGDGEALVRVRYASIDPTIRGWMNDVDTYLPAIGIGEVVRSAGLGEVVASNSDAFTVGDTVFGLLGWQDHAIVSAAGPVGAQVVPPGIDPGTALGLLGATGLTAYFGLLDVGRIVVGDHVVVSGAAGATGSVVGQIARIKGAASVVGLAGTDDKCAWLVDEAGFDHAINYKSVDVEGELRRLLPSGIDLFFDNVGGPILDTCIGQLARRGRVVLCGAISVYNATTLPPGPANYVNLIVQRGRMEGFIILDYADRFPDAQLQLATWAMEGRITTTEHFVDGLEHAPDALNLLFTGGNTGKVIVRL